MTSHSQGRSCDEFEKHSPVLGKEEIITAYGGNLMMKRILGVDLSGS